MGIIKKMKFILAAIGITAAVKVQTENQNLVKLQFHEAKQALIAERQLATIQTEQCEDLDWTETDSYGDGCEWYYGNEDSCGDYDDDDFWADAWCCACGGGW